MKTRTTGIVSGIERGRQRIGGRARSQQLAHHLDTAKFGCRVQRRDTRRVCLGPQALRDGGRDLEKALEGGGVARGSDQVKARCAMGIQRGHVRARSQQNVDHGPGALLRCEMQRLRLVGRHGVDVCAVLQQLAHCLDRACARGDVKRRLQAVWQRRKAPAPPIPHSPPPLARCRHARSASLRAARDAERARACQTSWRSCSVALTSTAVFSVAASTAKLSLRVAK